MEELIEKAYNCYIAYLNRLNYGKVDQSYCLLYDAILAIANDITEEKYLEYFINNLTCPILYQIEEAENINRMISWTLSSEETPDATFSWTELAAQTDTTYYVITSELVGFNFFYVSVPQSSNCIIYNELDMVLYNSTLSAADPSQAFSLAGTLTTSEGQANNILRKNDVYNTTHPVLFKVKLF